MNVPPKIQIILDSENKDRNYINSIQGKVGVFVNKKYSQTISQWNKNYNSPNS
jgi:hypothetical protein